jgi:DNA-binding NarL/FixJ family response regulator
MGANVARPGRGCPRLRRAALDADDGCAGALRDLVLGRWVVVDRFEAGGRRYFVVRPALRPTLSPREAQIVACAAEGRSNKVIAYELGLRIGTVSSSLSAALRKLGLESRADLVALAALAPEGGPCCV